MEDEAKNVLDHLSPPQARAVGFLHGRLLLNRFSFRGNSWFASIRNGVLVNITDWLDQRGTDRSK